MKESVLSFEEKTQPCIWLYRYRTEFSCDVYIFHKGI